MTTGRGHPCWGDEGLPLVVNVGNKRRLVGVGHGSKPIVVFRRKRDNTTLDDDQWSHETNRRYQDMQDVGILSCGDPDR